MEKILAPKQRAEAKHDAQQRQLPALAAVFLLAALTTGALAEAPGKAAPAEELRAAKLLETALFARKAGEAELAKLDRIYRELHEKYPQDAAILNAHGEFLWSMGNQPRALLTWLAAEKLAPENAEVLDHLAGSFLAAGDAKTAAAYYVRAIRSAPAVAAYHHSYANVAFLFRHELLDAAHPDAGTLLNEALEHFATAARLQPLDPEYARAYAETFYSVPTPDWHAALAAWEHFHRITPQKDFALLNIARVQMKLGQKAEARASLTQIQGAEFRGLKARLTERLEAE